MSATCPNCGKPVPASALQGLCPECMLKVGAASQTEAPGGAGPHGTKVTPLPAPAPEEIARHFPQLEILQTLGRGGMGVVYKARQPLLNRFVALKILAPEREKDPQFAERFMREAQALARLNHPNIVTVYDFGETHGLYYLLMEFVDGMNLRQLLQSRRLVPEEALAIVPRICEALQYAHDQGIVHRDIKPENVLLDKQGRVKIADFGIARMLGQPPAVTGLTGAEEVVGTPYYMAPEQVEKPGKVDHRADIYSLGVVFYEMLTGELPLGKFALPSRKVRVDVRLDEVVLHALEKEPERRYQQASHVKTAVETIVSTGVPREGRPPSRLLGVMWLALAVLGIFIAWKLLVLPSHGPRVLSPSGPLASTNRPAVAALRLELQTARQELADLRLRYTEKHPLVGTQLGKIKDLEQQIELREASPVSALTTTNEPFARGELGWFLAGSDPQDYEIAVDSRVTHSGKASACLRSKVPNPAGFGTLMQAIKADAFRGKRLRMTGYARSEALANRASLWMRVDGPTLPDSLNTETLAFDNMETHPIRGTTDWTRYDIVLDVPEAAEEIAFGVLLAGRGQAWIDDLNFESVGRDVPTTDARPAREALPAPKLDFEQQ